MIWFSGGLSVRSEVGLGDLGGLCVKFPLLMHVWMPTCKGTYSVDGRRKRTLSVADYQQHFAHQSLLSPVVSVA